MFRYDNGDGTNALLDPTSPEFRRMKNSIESMVIFFLFFLDHGNPFSFFEIMVILFSFF